ncbi:CoA transferase [Actinophytocola sp.]|uniref:CoA transferase n=1 Tax=Actinophytocola sp. TaxID=1872138 RepID=UPI003D6B7CD8
MVPGPLGGLVVRAASWPAAEEAAALLAALGARTLHTTGLALAAGGVEIRREPTDVATDWADSGAMTLTGPPDGSPLACTGHPATVARAAGMAVELLTTLAGTPVCLDGAPLLGARAAITGGTRHGQVSVGGAARLLPTADGWWALNLSRPTDLDLVPALLETGLADEPWPAITAWSTRRTAREATERAALLGLAAARPGETGTVTTPWHITTHPTSSPAAGTRTRPRVVNLGALWAAPLAANLLARGGAEVLDVEHIHRPDGSRHTTPDFYATLHNGHELITLDFADPAGRHRLTQLVRSADIVIEASRPRALRGLGLDAGTVLADGRRRTWLRITGHGQRNEHRIAFGDDAAVAGGLLGWDGPDPHFAGDAIADPLTGLLAAVAAIAVHHRAPHSTIIDLALAEVAAWCAPTRSRKPGTGPATKS